jgi:uncharacterized protein YndB with AHSA1/START domain
MGGKFETKVKVNIRANINAVWRGLTDPALIKQYFFGTNAVSDWKRGSKVFFRGEWEGKAYEDKGTILESDPPRLLQYNYWSSFSGTADVPENYAVVTYSLQPGADHTELTVTQDGIASEEAKNHSEANWKSVLDGLKNLLEK